jgi:tetratricopeptide (TPR) repeat protein
MAYEYAMRITKRVPETWIFWIQANTKLQFVEDYLGMASCLNLTGTGASPASVEDVSQCLRHSNFGNWVMIVDNFDDGEILDGKRPVVDLIPDNAKGSVIFTTRSKGVAARLTSVDNIIPVGNLEPNEARDLFCLNLGLTYTELRETDQASVAELLRSLNYLPLAICHAGSYMSGQQIEISEYLQAFNTSEDAKVLLLDDEDFPQAPMRVRPVLRTLAISLDHILKIDSKAADLLSFMACLAPKSIPRSLLPTANDADCMATHSFLKAVGLLRGYGLIGSDNDNHTFDMHAVVHLATRTWLRSRNEFQCWIQKALLSVFKRFPNAPSYESDNLSECARYLPPAEAVLGHKEFPPEYDRPRCLLAHRCSQYLQITGRYGHAEWFSMISADLSAAAFGEDDPDHFTKQEDHATILRQNGDFVAAIRIERAVLSNRQRILGAKHRDTFSSLNNLGLSLHGLGQYSEAEDLHRRALNGRRETLDQEDYHTLASLNNLSLSLERQKNFSEAEGLARNAVSLKRNIYGRESLSTLLSVSNLAICLQEQEKFDEAHELHAEVLRSRERQLGKHHPQTLSAKQGLIGSMVGQGQFERTERMARDHLTLTTNVLGPQHDQTLWMAYYLASILLKLGKSEEAEIFAREAFVARRKVLGIDHSDTKTCEELLDKALDQIKEERARTERKIIASLNPTQLSLSIPFPMEEKSLDNETTKAPHGDDRRNLNETNRSLLEEMIPDVPKIMGLNPPGPIRPENSTMVVAMPEE